MKFLFGLLSIPVSLWFRRPSRRRNNARAPRIIDSLPTAFRLRSHTSFVAAFVLAGFLTLFGTAKLSAAVPVVSSSGTAAGQVGVAFSYQITASNTPTSFSATGLPAGLSVGATTGVISGTPTVAATTTVTLSAINASGTGNKTLTLTTKPPTPVITSATTATGQKGVAFSYQITADNSPTSFAATGLPAGLTVSATSGLISGTPTTAATTNITIKAINTGGTGTTLLALTVNPATPVISSSATASGTTGHAFSYQITASNTPTSFTATNLPAGLNVSSTGLISGTPTSIGSSSITLGATNAGGSGNKILTLNVTLGIPVITSPSTATGVTGLAFSYQITANNAPTSYTATGLPVGLTVSTSTGLITGTVNTAATKSVTIKAINASGTGTATLSLTIHVPNSAMTSPNTATGNVGAAFNYQITATNSPSGYSATALPQGLSVNPTTGVISGTPTVPGNYVVTIGITNAGGTIFIALTISILPSLPYTADFENSEGYTVGSLHGQIGWTVLQGAATILSSDSANGSQSVQITPATPASTVSQIFAPATGQTIEHFDFFAKPVAAASLSSNNTFTVEGAKFGFQLSGGQGALQFFNGNGLGGGTWVSSPFTIPLGAGNQAQAWLRLTARLDFTNQKWDLYANGKMVAANVSLISNSTYLSKFQVQGDVSTSSGLDYIYAGPINPLFADANNNGIDDAWERAHGLSLSTNNRNLSPSGNGVAVIQSYVNGTDPNDFYNGAAPTLTILGGNNQVALAGQFNSAPFDIGVWNSAGTDPLVNAPVSFTVQSGGGKLAASNTEGAILSNTLNLFTDINGTAQVYYHQPDASYVQSFITVAAAISQVTFSTKSTIAEDVDGDGLPDTWEDQQLGTRSYGATDDPGNVGRTLLQSYQQNLSPWPVPAVADGLRAWYRADLGVVKDGADKVSRWTDVSGHGFHTEQISELNRQPTWTSGALNGQPVVTFDSSAGMVLRTPGMVDLQGGGGDVTLIAVLKPESTQLYGATLLDLDTQNGNGYNWGEEGITNQISVAWWDNVQNNWQGGPPMNLAATQAQVATAVKANTKFLTYKDGRLQGTRDVTSGLPAGPAVFTLGNKVGPYFGFNGQIAEVLIYNRALSDTERGQIETALRSKYISLDSDGDGLPDTWEDQQLGTRSYGASDDPGNVGRTLLQSYQQNLSPWPAPAVADGLRAWYRADLGVVKDGADKVSRWTDVSGHGFHTVQISELNRQPTWTSGALNGQPVVTFDSSAGMVLRTPGMVDLQGGGGDVTLIAVVKPESTQPYGATLLDLDKQNGNGYHWAEEGITNQITVSWWDNVQNNWQSGPSLNLAATQAQVAIAVKANTTLLTYKDGQLQGTRDVTAGLPAGPAVFALGNKVGPYFGFNGQIAEVFIYNRALSDTERQQIETGLTSRYSIQGGSSDVDPANGLSIIWENRYFGRTGIDPNADPDGDGLSNLQEYQQGSDPTDYYNGVSPTIISLKDPSDQLPSDGALDVLVQDPAGKPLINAPVDFGADADGFLVSATPAGNGSASVTVNSNVRGIARAYVVPSSSP